MSTLRLPAGLRQLIGLLAMRSHRRCPVARPDPRCSRRIAITKLDAIGDFVLATSLLDPLYQAGRHADVTLFCRGAVATLAATQFPRWEVVGLPPPGRPLRSVWRDRGWRRVLSRLRQFDLLLDLRSMRDMADAVVASWIPASYKVALRNQTRAAGVAFRFEHKVYDALLDPCAPEAGIAMDLLYYRTLGAFLSPDLDLKPLRPRLSLSPRTTTAVRRRLETELHLDLRRPLLVIAPGSLLPLKEYPVQLLAAAVAPFLDKHHVQVLITGAKADQRKTTQLLEALQPRESIHDTAGMFSLEEHLHVLALSQAALSMDSSTAHIAGALGVPAVVLLGGGQPGVFGPWGEGPRFQWLMNPVSCYGCQWICPFKTPVCIQGIRPERITAALQSIMDRRDTRSLHTP